MISNVHYIELYIQGQLVELESQTSLNLRINSVLFNPTKTSTKQGEYSYSFDIPSTPKNDKIFNYANTLSKTNKFHARYSTQVYADGNLIFDGSLTIQKYDAKNKKYTCNLVNIKIDTLDDIFGETKLTDLKWMIDFDGATDINSVNNDSESKYFFPLVSYGVFQKKAVSTDEVGSNYTAKHTLDKYNKWWIESFYPSLNMVETVRKAFENKGYNVDGSAFRDPNISNIYMSCNLAEGQTPIYNVGNPKFGEVSINATWNNYRSAISKSGNFSGGTRMNSTGGLDQELTFPYEYIQPAINASNNNSSAEYNFDAITIWNMMDTTNNSAVTVSVENDSYMYDPNEMVIVIPADGWYKINMNCNVKLSGSNTSFSATQWTTTFYQDDAFERQKVEMRRDIASQQTPIEIQLIKNYSNNVELIKGKYNKIWATGKPLQTEYTFEGGSNTGGTFPNLTEWTTDCPHQDPYGSRSPTKTSEMINQATAARNRALEAYDTGNDYGDTVYTNSNGNFGGQRTTRGGTISTAGGRDSSKGGTITKATKKIGTKYNTYGFMHRDCSVMPYDQAVSTAFICGFSSMNARNGCGTVAVQRDGYSWSPMSSVRNGVFCNVEGLDLVDISGNGTTTIATNYCKNTYPNCPNNNYCSVSNDGMTGAITCCVYLNKNDILEIVAVQRSYEEGQMYSCSGNCHVDITAMSSKTKTELKSNASWGYYSTTDFPTQLNLFNFTNSETKVSDWINNIKTAFNLEILQDGKNVEINTNQGIKKNITYAVDVDNRVNSNEAVSEYISYPREMSVKYRIDKDEWGFELTVPQEHINDEDWFEWGDSGFTIINLSDDSYETSTQNTSTQFSYTWYDNFLWKQVNQDGTETETSKTIAIPVISKAEYMAEGYGYDEAMKHDGYSLTQRFWYRDQISQEYIWLSDHMHEKVYLTYPTNQWDRFNLSYKDTEQSIVTEYFNISPMLASNYVKIDVHITPIEYNDIKGGALVHFDSDLYYTSEISGYDPTGSNPTTLKLIKKI